jgi:hypothetical protein
MQTGMNQNAKISTVQPTLEREATAAVKTAIC